MRALLTITCKKCRCSMQFADQEAAFEKNVICQNCGQPLPEEYRELFNATLSAIYDIPSETDRFGVIEDYNGFKFDLKTGSQCAAEQEE